MGMRQRLGVARCLLADPLLLILDEPTNGLDPGGIQEFREMIRAMVEQEGRTVFISSHLLDEVEKTCDAAAIVDRGKIVTQGAIADLAAGGGARHELIVAVDDADRALAHRCEASELVREARLDDEGIRVVLAGEPGRPPPQINAAARTGGRRRDAPGARPPQPRAALPADHRAPRRGPRAGGGEGMSTAIAMRMVGADFLKLRKKRSTLIWALVLALAPLLIFFIVKALQHSSSPAEHGPAGGIGGFTRRAARCSRVFFGPLAAIMIGTDGGAGDLAAGVFRDLVVTGRSRVALFASRVPAALGLCWLVVLAGYALTLIGTYALASGTPTPSAALVLNGLLFTLFSTGVVCVVAVGFASLIGSRPAALTVLIGWQLIASRDPRKHRLARQLAQADPQPGGRALQPDRPRRRHGPRGGATVTMSTGTAVIVALGWIVFFAALGAWRTRTMDA